MPLYEVTNRHNGETLRVEAPFAADACERAGWMIGHCYVRLLREGPFSDLTKRHERLVAAARIALDEMRRVYTDVNEDRSAYVRAIEDLRDVLRAEDRAEKEAKCSETTRLSADQISILLRLEAGERILLEGVPGHWSRAYFSMVLHQDEVPVDAVVGLAVRGLVNVWPRHLCGEVTFRCWPRKREERVNG